MVHRGNDCLIPVESAEIQQRQGRYPVCHTGSSDLERTACVETVRLVTHRTNPLSEFIQPPSEVQRI